MQTQRKQVKIYGRWNTEQGDPDTAWQGSRSASGGRRIRGGQNVRNPCCGGLVLVSHTSCCCAAPARPFITNMAPYPGYLLQTIRLGHWRRETCHTHFLEALKSGIKKIHFISTVFLSCLTMYAASKVHRTQSSTHCVPITCT